MDDTAAEAWQWLVDVIEGGGPVRGVLTAGAILLLGIFTAAIGQRMAEGLTRRAAGVLARWNRGSSGADTESLAKSIGRTVYWFIVVLAIMAATESAQLPVVTTWLSRVASFLPRIAVAIVIVAFGSIAARVARHVVTGAASSASFPASARLGRMAHVALLVCTWLVAVEQVGIEVSFLKTTLLILLGAALGGAAIAFGIGGGRAVGDIITTHFLQKVYQVGQVLRTDAVEGRIVRFTETAVVIDGPDGEVVIPARQIADNRSTIVTRPGGAQ